MMQFRDLDEEKRDKTERLKKFHVCLWDRNNDEPSNTAIIPKGIIYIEEFKEGSIGYFVGNVLNEVVKLKVSSIYKTSIFKESRLEYMDYYVNEKYDDYKRCFITGDFVIDSTIYHVFFDKVGENDVKLPPHTIISVS